MKVPGCYAGRILRVDLSTGAIEDAPTSDYLPFVGGRGFGTKIYWDEVGAAVRPFDPENELIFVTGPLTGFAGTGSSRWQVYGKSPVADREGFSYCNAGGTWGVVLKSAGFDAIVVRGRATEPVYLSVRDSTAKLVAAGELVGKGAVQTRKTLKGQLGDATAVVAIGPAGENRVAIANMLADQEASAGCGFGAVMGSKGLKAIAVARGSRRLTAANPKRLREVVKYRKFLAGSDAKLRGSVPPGPKLQDDFCWGCPGPCIRRSYQADDGTRGKFMCQASSYYRRYATTYYDSNPGDIPFQATNLCNEYGLDTMAVGVMMNWLNNCGKAGVISDDDLGAPLSKIGSWEYVSTLLPKVAYRQGIGDLLAEGTKKAAEHFGAAAVEQIKDVLHKAEANSTYGPRLYIANGIVYALEPRQPKQFLHEINFTVDQWAEWVRGREDAFVTSDTMRAFAKRFWGDEAGADQTSYEGKAAVAKRIQDRNYAKELLVLCDFMWPVYMSRQTPDGVGDPSLESQVLSAVTGWETTEEEYYELGAKMVEFQRAIMLREGHRGREDDVLPAFCYDLPMAGEKGDSELPVPGPNGTVASRKAGVVDRAAFEAMKAEYYQLRGWDADGIPPDRGIPERGIVAERATEESTIR